MSDKEVSNTASTDRIIYPIPDYNYQGFSSSDSTVDLTDITFTADNVAPDNSASHHSTPVELQRSQSLSQIASPCQDMDYLELAKSSSYHSNKPESSSRPKVLFKENKINIKLLSAGMEQLSILPSEDTNCWNNWQPAMVTSMEDSALVVGDSPNVGQRRRNQNILGISERIEFHLKKKTKITKFWDANHPQALITPLMRGNETPLSGEVVLEDYYLREAIENARPRTSVHHMNLNLFQEDFVCDSYAGEDMETMTTLSECPTPRMDRMDDEEEFMKEFQFPKEKKKEYVLRVAEESTMDESSCCISQAASVPHEDDSISTVELAHGYGLEMYAESPEPSIKKKKKTYQAKLPEIASPETIISESWRSNNDAAKNSLTSAFNSDTKIAPESFMSALNERILQTELMLNKTKEETASEMETEPESGRLDLSYECHTSDNDFDQVECEFCLLCRFRKEKMQSKNLPPLMEKPRSENFLEVPD